jgi:tRNA G18 (ribose-2'-O)-methylase SpoU
MVLWEQSVDIAPILARLKTEGVTIVAIEQAESSVSLFDFISPENVAYIFGNEITGITPDVLASCDLIVEIPMQGQKESLNVSVTAGIVLFQKSV